MFKKFGLPTIAIVLAAAAFAFAKRDDIRGALATRVSE